MRCIVFYVICSCISKLHKQYGGKIYPQGAIRRDRRGLPLFSVITVTGPRQSGKTTLLRNLFSYLPYYSLENLDVRSFAENDPVAFLNQHTEGMILDEVHNAPNLLSYIQGMVDNDADRRFILSGSSQFAMLKRLHSLWQDVPPFSSCSPCHTPKYGSRSPIRLLTTCCLTGFTLPFIRAVTYPNFFIRRT